MEIVHQPTIGYTDLGTDSFKKCLEFGWQGDTVYRIQWGDFVQGVLSKRILSGGILFRGLCPSGFCLGGFCPRGNFVQGDLVLEPISYKLLI